MIEVPTKEEFEKLDLIVRDLEERLVTIETLVFQHESDIIQLKSQLQPMPTEVKLALQVVLGWALTQ